MSAGCWSFSPPDKMEEKQSVNLEKNCRISVFARLPRCSPPPCPGKSTTTLCVTMITKITMITMINIIYMITMITTFNSQYCTQVCDNVDLKIILEEYASYHQVKYGKRPDICRRAEREAGSEGSLQGNPARRRKAQKALNKMKRWQNFATDIKCNLFSFMVLH